MKQVAYSHADKYVLAKDYYDFAPFTVDTSIFTPYGAFYITGEYRISKGFLFSANAPAINTQDSRRAACVHDFFYSLMKDGYLDRKYRYDVDYLFYNQLLEDGMVSFRAWYWFRAVRLGGDNALNSPRPKVILAPPKSTLPAGHQVRDSLKL
jgi:hypothetical protein